MNTIWIVLPILTLLMFELGLNLKIEDFKLFKTRPKPVLAGLIGQIIILPLLAWIIGKALGLDPIFLIGFVLIACCPGGSSSNVFSMLAKGLLGHKVGEIVDVQAPAGLMKFEILKIEV